MSTQLFPASTGMTVFYADDDRDDRDTFRDIILEINHHIDLHTHDDGEELLAALKNPPPTPSIIFLDLNMPRKNGFEVLQEIRSFDLFINLPVVIISTSDDEETINRCLALGATLYMSKPTNYTELKQQVNHLLNTDWDSFKPNSGSFVYRNN